MKLSELVWDEGIEINQWRWKGSQDLKHIETGIRYKVYKDLPLNFYRGQTHAILNLVTRKFMPFDDICELCCFLVSLTPAE